MSFNKLQLNFISFFDILTIKIRKVRKPDEKSSIKWIDINDATKVTNEEKMRTIYEKLNSKIKYKKWSDK